MKQLLLNNCSLQGRALFFSKNERHQKEATQTMTQRVPDDERAEDPNDGSDCPKKNQP